MFELNWCFSPHRLKIRMKETLSRGLSYKNNKEITLLIQRWSKTLFILCVSFLFVSVWVALRIQICFYQVFKCPTQCTHMLCLLIDCAIACMRVQDVSLRLQVFPIMAPPLLMYWQPFSSHWPLAGLLVINTSNALIESTLIFLLHKCGSDPSHEHKECWTLSWHWFDEKPLEQGPKLIQMARSKTWKWYSAKLSDLKRGNGKDLPRSVRRRLFPSRARSSLRLER